jgi:hypothetical protein
MKNGSNSDWRPAITSRDFLEIIIVIIIIIIHLNCKLVFTRWQWYYNKTQHINNTPHTNKHSTQTINDALHTMNTMQIQLQLQQIQLQLKLNKLILIKNKYTIH